MKRLLSPVLLVCAGPGQANAGDLLTIGRVESILLAPRGAPTCPDPSGSTKNADGSIRVVISGAELEQVGVHRRFDAQPFREIAGVAVNKRAVDEDGFTSLNDSLLRLPSTR